MPLSVAERARRIEVALRIGYDEAPGEACWEWHAERDRDGYGRVGRLRAHRLVYERAFGPIPSGLSVLHRCDNPSCVRPDHLFLGTQADNVADCVAKGRRAPMPVPKKHLRSRG